MANALQGEPSAATSGFTGAVGAELGADAPSGEGSAHRARNEGASRRRIHRQGNEAVPAGLLFQLPELSREPLACTERRLPNAPTQPALPTYASGRPHVAVLAMFAETGWQRWQRSGWG